MSTRTPIFQICSGSEDVPVYNTASSSSNLSIYQSETGGRYDKSFEAVPIDRPYAITEVQLHCQNIDPQGPSHVSDDKIQKVILNKVKSVQPDVFVVDPHVHKYDVASVEQIRMSNDYLRDVDGREEVDQNGQPMYLTWFNSFMEAGNQKQFNVRWPLPLHITTGEIHHIDLVFQTPSEVTTCENFFLGHKAIANSEGEFKLKFTGQQLNALFARTVKGVDRNQHHIIPLKIERRMLRSNLPVTYECRLTASRPRNNNTTAPVYWSTGLGGQSYGAHQSGVDSVHQIISPGQQSSTERETLFVASNQYNSPDFARWVNVDRDDLLNDLKKARSNENDPFVQVRCPADASVEPKTILEFLIISEKDRLNNICAARNLPFIQVVHDQNSTEKYFQVPYVALEQVILYWTTKYDRDNIAMRLDDLTLHFRPLKQAKANGEVIGVSDLKKAVALISGSAKNGEFNAFGKYTSVMQVIRITYDVYRGNANSRSVKEECQMLSSSSNNNKPSVATSVYLPLSDVGMEQGGGKTVIHSSFDDDRETTRQMSGGGKAKKKGGIFS